MLTKSFFDLLIFKTRANLKVEIHHYYLNFLWWLLIPLCNMAIYYLVFGIFMHSQTPHYAIFLLIGTTQWQWFSSTVQHASMSIYSSRNIMRRISIPKIFFPLEIFLRDTYKYLFSVLILSLILIIYPLPITAAWCSLPLIFFVQALLVFSVAIFFAAITPFFPDFQHILSTLLNLLFFASGIFFDPNQFILPEHRVFIYANPVAGIIREYRQVIINGQWPDWLYLFCVTLALTVFSFFTLYLLKRYNNSYLSICDR